MTGRFLCFYVVLAVPFLRLLVRASYTLWRPEVVALLAILAIPCLALARLTRSTLVFRGAAAIWAAYFATTSVKAEFFAAWEWKWVFLLLTVLMAGATALLRERFTPIAAMLLCGMFGSEVAMAVSRGNGSVEASVRPERARPPHTIHLVLDEQIGLAGFPRQYAACDAAAKTWSETLSGAGFTVYPNAFSNYDTTWNSLPSILNRQLLDHVGQFRGHNNVLVSNAEFKEAKANGFDLAIYQSDYVRFAAPEFGASLVREYDSNDVSAMLESESTWTERASRLLTWYAQLDRPTAVAMQTQYSGLVHAAKIGPLSVRGLWPGGLERDIARAARPTLFYAHLLHPHYPYVFDAKGKPLPFRDWHGPVSATQEGYAQRYAEYCGQSEFLAHQLKGFFDTLRREGVLEHSRIVLHGDHGSRIRVSADASNPDTKFASEPPLRHLLDSFSAMLAIREPGTQSPRIDPAKRSVLALLGGKGSEEALNTVYQFGPDGRTTRRFRILDVWKE